MYSTSNGAQLASIGIFASLGTSKVPKAYYAMFWGMGCKGLDAFSQTWARQGVASPLASINGPLADIGLITRNILVDK
eukprot:gene7589-744_t